MNLVGNNAGITDLCILLSEVFMRDKRSVQAIPRSIQDTAVPWLVPLALVCMLVFVFPIIQIVRLSFTVSTLTQPSSGFTLASYASLVSSPDFFSMLGTTMLFVGASVIFQVGLGFSIAMFIDSGVERKMFGTMIVRTAVLAAWALPGVVAGVVWKMVFSEMDSGPLSALVHLVDPGFRPNYLSSPGPALVASTVANIWRGTAYSMILIYAGLKTFPKELKEAAIIDRTNAVQRLFLITLPVLAPLLLICVLLVTVQTFNTFDLLRALTGGGPGKSTEVIALSIYRTIFVEFDLGRGSATAMVLLGINVVMTWVYFKYLARVED